MLVSYKDFAEEISFFEFREKEFGNNIFSKEIYQKELEEINHVSNIGDLVRVLEEFPKIFDLYEGYFQNSTFTIAQYTNFLFDVNKLNYLDKDLLKSYLINSCLNYENGIINEKFMNYYSKISNEGFSKYEVKKAIADYVCYLQGSSIDDKKRELLYKHIKNNITTRTRIAEYLITSYDLAKHTEYGSIEKSLLLKRSPLDPKAFSGRYGTYRIEKIIKDFGFKELASELKKEISTLNPINFEGLSYIKEAKLYDLGDASKLSNKVFDFILLKDGAPFFLIETNFYSTQGSKIGINEGEYISLSKEIKDFSTNNKRKLYFSWITDGNYWLSTGGKGRWERIRQEMDYEFEILNYSLLEKYLPEITKL